MLGLRVLGEIPPKKGRDCNARDRRIIPAVSSRAPAGILSLFPVQGSPEQLGAETSNLFCVTYKEPLRTEGFIRPVDEEHPLMSQEFLTWLRTGATIVTKINSGPKP